MARIYDPLTCGFANVFMYELFANRFGTPHTENWKENANKRSFEKFCLRYKDTDKSFNKSFVDEGPGIIERIQLLGIKIVKQLTLVYYNIFQQNHGKSSPPKRKKNTPSTTVTNVCAITSSGNILNKFLLQTSTTNVRQNKNFENEKKKKNALKDRTNQILQETDGNIRKEFKTTFTKQVK